MSSVKSLQVSMIKVLAMFAVLFAITMVWALMPQPAKAAGLTAEQKQAVINLLASFGAEQSVLNNVSLSLNGGVAVMVPPSTASSTGNMHMPMGMGCGLFVRNIVRGSAGDDVRDLQEFLRKTGDLKATSTTNFFGPMTEEALKMWQRREGIVTSGDAQTTGFGMVGPMTRKIMLERCKDLRGDIKDALHDWNDDHGNQGQNGHEGDNRGPWGNATTSPVCVLRASKPMIRPGESVVLAWESRNATYASSIDGSQGPVNGSLTQAPTQTTTYVKRVYNGTSQGECMTTVTVGTTTPATEKKVVVMPSSVTITRVLSLMTSGMAAVMDGYLSLFNLSLE
jgi:peptidoglycan hydrolase-like protein with peptidoglycan-binding domain